MIHPMDDPTAKDVIRIVDASGVLDFWNDPEEDVCAINDGEAINAE